MKHDQVYDTLMYQVGMECIKWCRKTYGKRSHRPIPKLILTAKRGKYAEYSYYENQIECDIKKHLKKKGKVYIGLDLDQYVDSIIHEYQHYLQDWSLLKTIGFDQQGQYIHDNIYEQLAVDIAARDGAKCIEYLNQKLNLQHNE